jgi:hypothetical protein
MIPSRLLDWVFKVCKYIYPDDNNHEVYFLSVTLLDRLGNLLEPNNNNYQLIGATCFMISSKMIEFDSPKLNILVDLSCNSFSEKTIVQTELKILTALNWDLYAPSPVNFVYLFMSFIENDLGSEESSITTKTARQP